MSTESVPDTTQSSSPRSSAATSLNAVVLENVRLTPELFILKLKPDAGVPHFLSGQYVAIGLPHTDAEGKTKLIRRAYSIGSSPSEKDYIELYIALVPNGELTPRLFELNAGDRINVAPKITGTFTLDGVGQGKDLVLISTGTGLAPFISMLRTPSTWEKVGNIYLLHGVRYQRDLSYKDEIIQHVNDTKRLTYIPVCSREEVSLPIIKGHVQRVFKEDLVTLDAGKQHVFMCGNPAMVEEMEKHLGELGFTEHTKRNPGNMHLEKYW